MRRLISLVLICALGATLLAMPVSAGAAGGSDGQLTAAKYNKKKCKKAKKKRTKRAKKLQKKYCKKKRRRGSGGQQGGQTGGGQTGGGQTGGGQTGGGQTGSGVVRDDAGFTNALVGSKLSKTSEGSVGYGEYTWNFCAGGQWAYKSYYYAGSTAESNDGGSYQVVEGYHAASDPNYFAGVIQATTSSGSQYRWGVELRGNAGYMLTKTSSFEEGTFSRTIGGAVC